MHWLWTIIWSLLALSGFGMVSAKNGWIVNFDYVLADYIHRTFAAVFVIMTLISVFYEIYRSIKNRKDKLPWYIIGRNGYQLFTFITTLLLIITGALIWICAELNMSLVAFVLSVHEYISYLTLASVIWHIYKKCHALIWPQKKQESLKRE